MSRVFPSIKPSDRDFKMGVYPTRSYRSLAGTTVKRSFGNKPIGYELRLRFNNIRDSVLDRILAHYDDTAGGFDRFPLPDAIFAGIDESVQARIQSPNNIRWEYAEPPSVQSVISGISTVSVSFVGELNV
jgi:hypothetical protein